MTPPAISAASRMDDQVFPPGSARLSLRLGAGAGAGAGAGSGDAASSGLLSNSIAERIEDPTIGLLFSSTTCTTGR